MASPEQNSLPLRPALVAGALAAGLAVAVGAFGAHALRQMVDARGLEIFETATRYLFYHAFGLIALALASAHVGAAALKWLRISAILIGVGILFFCGSLYTIVFSGVRSFGAVAPIGGTAFIVAWLLFGLGVLRRP